MSSTCSFIFMQIKVIFIIMVSHLDSLWNRGTRELGNGLFKSASRLLVRFWNYSRDYSLNCTPLDPITIKARLHRSFCRGNSMQFLSRLSCIKFQTCSKLLRYRSDKSHWKSHLVYTCDFEVATLARQKLHRGAATKIACVNGPLQIELSLLPIWWSVFARQN